MTEEINATDWKAFCQRITAMEKGQLVTIEAIDPGGARREIARAVALESVDLKPRDACNDSIRINAADGFEYEILEPIHIRLGRNPGGGFNPVQIHGETGTTILHFRPALKPTVLEGLALA